LFAELLDGPLVRPRFNAFLIGIFGVAALLLAAIGLCAALAASVERYTEMGVRVALGADALGRAPPGARGRGFGAPLVCRRRTRPRRCQTLN
jgi:hypothetical protein